MAVHPSARGLGLGCRMLEHLIARPALQGVTTLTTTITEENGASWALFNSFARRQGAKLARRPIFDRDAHFAGAHDTEFLVSIGPLAAPNIPSEKEKS